MRHPTGAQIQSQLDGESSAADAERLVRHIEDCARCAEVVARFRERAALLSVIVRTVDRAEPSPWRSRAATSRATGPSRRRETPPAIRRAAILLFAILGGVGAAIAQAVARHALSRPDDAVVQPAAVAPAAGVFLVPGADSATVLVERAGPGARIRVRATARTDVSVTVETNAGTPRFRVDDRASRVVVDLLGAGGVVVIEMPSSLRSGVVRAGERVIVHVRSGVVEPDEAGTGVPIDS